MAACHELHLAAIECELTRKLRCERTGEDLPKRSGAPASEWRSKEKSKAPETRGYESDDDGEMDSEAEKKEQTSRRSWMNKQR